MKEGSGGYMQCGKATWSMIGSRALAASNRDVEKPGASWPEQRPGGKATWSMIGSRALAASNRDVEKPGASWPEQRPSK